MATLRGPNKRISKLTALKKDNRAEPQNNSSNSDNDRLAGDSKLLIIKDPEDSDNVKILKSRITKLEAKNNSLFYENEKLILDLDHERHKVAQLELQLQFVKDNQSTFEELRQTYITMKYNELHSGRKLVEIRDKSVQTWDGILCRACLDTEKIRSKLEAANKLYNNFDDYIIVKQSDIDKVKATVQLLKCYKEIQEIDLDAKDILESVESFHSSDFRLSKTKLRLAKFEEDKQQVLDEHYELLKGLSSDEEIIYYNKDF